MSTSLSDARKKKKESAKTSSCKSPGSSKKKRMEPSPKTPRAKSVIVDGRSAPRKRRCMTPTMDKRGAAATRRRAKVVGSLVTPPKSGRRSKSVTKLKKKKSSKKKSTPKKVGFGQVHFPVSAKKKKKAAVFDLDVVSESKAAMPTKSKSSAELQSYEEFVAAHRQLDAIDARLAKLLKAQTLRSLDDMKEAPKVDSGFFVEATELECIRVIARFRPQSDGEDDLDEDIPAFISEATAEPTYASKDTVELFRCSEADSDKKALKFTLDFVLPPTQEQSDVLNLVGRPFVENVLKGFNGTIFAYGQTGSGKEYSMFGPPKADHFSDKEYGLIPRSVALLFRRLHKEETLDSEFQVSMQCVQLYNSRLLDAMNPGGVRKGHRKLKIVTDFRREEVYVENLTKMAIGSVPKFLGEMRKVLKQRIEKAHLILMLKVRQEFDGTVTKATLNFVLLAGSEDEEVAGLRSVIDALVAGRQPSYRSSMLTHMLKDSLGGNSKTTIVVHLSPHWSNRSETIRSLRFALAAKKVKNKAKVNRSVAKSELKKKVRSLNAEMERMRAELSKAHAKCDILQSQKRVESTSKLKRTTRHLAKSKMFEGYGDEDDFESDEDFDEPKPTAESSEHSKGTAIEFPALDSALSAAATGGSGLLALGLSMSEPMPARDDSSASVVDQLLSGKDMELRFQEHANEYLDTIEALRSKTQAQEKIIGKKDDKLQVLFDALDELQSANRSLEDELEDATGAKPEEKSGEFEAEKQALVAKIQDLETEKKVLRDETRELKKESASDNVAMHSLKEENALLRQRLEGASMISPMASTTSLTVAETALAEDSSEKSDTAEVEEDADGGAEESELEAIELLLLRFAGRELKESGIAQKERIGTVAKMVFDLNEEIGAIMDKWLLKDGTQRLQRDELIFQTKHLIAQFQVCTEQLAETGAKEAAVGMQDIGELLTAEAMAEALEAEDSEMVASMQRPAMFLMKSVGLEEGSF